MEKYKKLSESEIKAAISKIRDRKRPDIAGLSQSARVLGLRRKLGKQLQPVVAAAGLDVKKINKILAEHQTELRSALDKEKSKSAKTFGALAANLRRGIENQSRALQHLQSKPLIITPITLWTAQIFATPLGMLVNSGAEAGNNWAKVFLFDKTDSARTLASVYFYFFWQNQSEYLAVFNVDSGLVAQGDCSAAIFPDYLSGSSVELTGLFARLTVYVGGADILKEVQIGRDISVSSLPALFGGSADSATLEVVAGAPYDLFCSNISLDPGQFAVFEVRFFASYSISGGSISLDFSEGDKFIMCPSLTIELLTAPAAGAGLQSGLTQAV